MRKNFIIMLLIVVVFSIAACSSPTNYNDITASSTQESTTELKTEKIVTVLDRSKVATDILKCEEIGASFLIALAIAEPQDNIKTELETVQNLFFEVKVNDDATQIKCLNSNNMNDVIKEANNSLVRLSNPVLNKNLDGSGIVQTQYYVVLSKDTTVKVYISGEGKTLEDILNDKEGDGIYQCYPNVCKEYTIK